MSKQSSSQSSQKKPPKDLVGGLIEKNSGKVSKAVKKAYMWLGPFVYPEKINLKLDWYVNVTNSQGQYSGTMMFGNTFHGFGALLKETGQIFEGVFNAHKPKGPGRLIDTDGKAYEGNWVDDQLVGVAKIITKKYEYEGQLMGNKPHGRGSERTKIGKYTGTFVDGVKEGYGELKYTNSSIYKGNFVANKRHGHGKLTTPAGEYEGVWENDCLNGEGSYKADDYTYKGNFTEDFKEGYGVIAWNDGKKYKGGWKNDKFYGQGTYIDENNTRINGVWKNGKLKSENELVKTPEEISYDIVKKRHIAQGVFFDSSEADKQTPASEETKSRGSFKPNLQILKNKLTQAKELTDDSLSFYKEDLKDEHKFYSSSNFGDTSYEEELLQSQSFGRSSDISAIKFEKYQEKLKNQVEIDEDMSFKADNELYLSSFLESKASEINYDEVSNENLFDSVNDSAYIVSSSDMDNYRNKQHKKKRMEYEYESSLNEVHIEKSDKSSEYIESGREIGDQAAVSVKFRDSNSVGSDALNQEFIQDSNSSVGNSDYLVCDASNQDFIQDSITYAENTSSVVSSALNQELMQESRSYIEQSVSRRSSKSSSSQLGYESESIDKTSDVQKVSYVYDNSEDLQDSEKFNMRYSYESSDPASEQELLQSVTQSIIDSYEQDHRAPQPLNDSELPYSESEKSFLNESSITYSEPNTSRFRSPSLDFQLPKSPDDMDAYEISEIEEILDTNSQQSEIRDKRIWRLQNTKFPVENRTDFVLLFNTRRALGPFAYDDVDAYKSKLKPRFSKWRELNGIYYYGEKNKRKQRSGRGIEIYYNQIYEGYFKSNKRQGLGRVITKDGDVYEGYWENNVKSGFGVLKRANGETYVGDWTVDMPNGWGYEDNLKERYDGNIKYGLRHGFGKLIMQDGAMYEGQFWEDKPHGLGNLIREDGTVYNGIFIKGEIKGSGEKVPNYDDRAKIPRIKDSCTKDVVLLLYKSPGDLTGRVQSKPESRLSTFKMV